MTLPDSLLSYGDCLDFFEHIADDPRGGRIEIGTEEEAKFFRLRCNQFRRLHRKENKKIHAPDTRLHGASEYDQFMLQLKEDTNHVWWVYATRMALQPGQVELLSDLDGEPNGSEAD